jgi:hypothetical protein
VLGTGLDVTAVDIPSNDHSTAAALDAANACQPLEHTARNKERYRDYDYENGKGYPKRVFHPAPPLKAETARAFPGQHPPSTCNPSV